jgi:hypothetical protein
MQAAKFGHEIGRIEMKVAVLIKICQWNQKNCIFRRLRVFV